MCVTVLERIPFALEQGSALLGHDPAEDEECNKVRRRHEPVERVGKLPYLLQSADRADGNGEKKDAATGQHGAADSRYSKLFSPCNLHSITKRSRRHGEFLSPIFAKLPLLNPQAGSP